MRKMESEKEEKGIKKMKNQGIKEEGGEFVIYFM